MNFSQNLQEFFLGIWKKIFKGYLDKQIKQNLQKLARR